MSQTHRQQKKQQTRQALIDGAYQLFKEKGYEGTTLADITKRANCAPRTFFRYFTAKEDLLLIHVDDLWDSLEHQLEYRPPHANTLDVLKMWSKEVIDDYQENPKSFLRVLEQDIHGISVSAEARRQLYSMERMQQALAKSFAQDLHTDSTDLVPQLIAAAAAAMFDVHHKREESTQINPYMATADIIGLLSGMVVAAKKE